MRERWWLGGWFGGGEGGRGVGYIFRWWLGGGGYACLGAPCVCAPENTPKLGANTMSGCPPLLGMGLGSFEWAWAWAWAWTGESSTVAVAVVIAGTPSSSPSPSLSPPAWWPWRSRWLAHVSSEKNPRRPVIAMLGLTRIVAPCLKLLPPPPPPPLPLPLPLLPRWLLLPPLLLAPTLTSSSPSK